MLGTTVIMIGKRSVVCLRQVTVGEDEVDEISCMHRLQISVMILFLEIHKTGFSS